MDLTVLQMFIGDICMDPTNYFVSLFPSGTSRDVISYYTTCEGTNPLQYDIGNATIYANELNSSIAYLQSACGNNPFVQDAIPDINNIIADVNSLVSQTDCQGIYNVWDEAINQGLCTYLFTGFYAMWITQFVISGSLYLTMCFSSVLYLYFGFFWKLPLSRWHEESIEVVLGTPVDESSISGAGIGTGGTENVLHAPREIEYRTNFDSSFNEKAKPDPELEYTKDVEQGGAEAEVVAGYILESDDDAVNKKATFEVSSETPDHQHES